MKAETITGIYPARQAPWQRPSGLWSMITVVMRRQPVWISILLPIILTLGLGWMDDISGWEVSLFILYAVPIILAVWWDGAIAGLVVSALSGIVFWWANIDSHPYETMWGYGWALVNRMFYFGVVVFAVMAVRKKQDADADHILMLEERRQLELDIVSVSEHEQQRIGQDLHDGLCQHLAAIGLAVRALAEDLQARDVPEVHDALMIEESLQQAVMEARNLARGIFPVHVDRDGLSAALNDLARITSKLTGAEIVVQEDAEVLLDNPEASMNLYRIAQEAVGNAVRHGRARRVEIRLCMKPAGLELRIHDDGGGMLTEGKKAAGTGSGMGLRTMRYRAQAMGATLQIKSQPGNGTVVLCKTPVQTQTTL
ncbi:MAG TPA: sensor histidine kinase [Prosthecobacter sp.]